MRHKNNLYIGHFYVHCPHCGGSFYEDVTTPPHRSGGHGHIDATCPHCHSVFTAQTA